MAPFGPPSGIEIRFISCKQVLAHRPSWLGWCDQVVVLQDGRVRRISVNLFRIEDLFGFGPFKFYVSF